MSYRNPKQTYVSSQPAISKMQDDIVSAAKGIADRKRLSIEKERVQGEKIWALGQGATQNYINNTLDQNNIGTQGTLGAVERLFKGTGAKVGELTIATQGPNAQCKTDGNCEELMRELAVLEKGPETVKNFVTNVTSQLDISKFVNMDKGQNSRAMKAGAILTGTNELNEAQGYTYEIVPSENNDGTYDMVFNYSGEDENSKFYNPNTDKYESTFKFNSGAFMDLENNDSDLFVRTPQPGTLMGNVLDLANVYSGATYDEKGVRSGGTLNAVAEKFALKDADGKPITYDKNLGTEKKPDNRKIMQIDKDLIGEDVAIQEVINDQINNFIGPGGDDGEARALWNMHLSKAGKGENQFDEDLAKEVWGDGLSVEELKTKWGETTTAWGYNEPLTNEQKEIFKHAYKKFTINQMYDEMVSYSNINELSLGTAIAVQNNVINNARTNAGFGGKNG
jgi:hypothetical protein|tara:strand:+ start:525 stop:1877 length:1353 start_codon:yes stop_codon:yes gene_type:complete